MKKLMALFCALVLVLSVMTVPASASGLFFLSLNDTLPPQSPQTTPIQHSGWVYVPVSVFNNRVTGVNFGIYYGFTDNNESLIFYTLSGKTLTFDLVNGTATAEGSDPPVPSRVTWQNGVCYVPAYALCRYFGLTYSFYTTEYGPLLRIKDGSAYLSDSLFISSASSMMRNRYNSYYGTQTQPVTPPSTPQPPPEEPPEVIEPDVPEVPEEERPTFSLTVGLRASEGQDITAALAALGNVRASAVVFFPAEALVSERDQIREAAGRGHKVGIIPAGDTAAERLESVERGSEVLAQILRQETWFVLGSDADIAEAGYICWSPGLTPSGGATGIYENILQHCEGRSGSRVLFSSQTSSGVLRGVLNQLSEDGDTFLQPRETLY